MIGHCGGLRPSQKIGDFVLAHAYLRDDHVLDDVLPPEIPLPAIAEVQQALAGAAEEVSAASQGADLKQRMRTGTVVTTDDRNWELRYTPRPRAACRKAAPSAIEMESATVAAQGYRFRVPYGTLLCVSDKPLHGEIKLPGQANKFYEEAIAAHLQIGIRACERLRAEGAAAAQPQTARVQRAAVPLDLGAWCDFGVLLGRFIGEDNFLGDPHSILEPAQALDEDPRRNAFARHDVPAQERVALLVERDSGKAVLVGERERCLGSPRFGAIQTDHKLDGTALVVGGFVTLVEMDAQRITEHFGIDLRIAKIVLGEFGIVTGIEHRDH